MAGEMPKDVKASIALLDNLRGQTPQPANLKPTRTMEDIALPVPPQPGQDIARSLAIIDGLNKPEDVEAAPNLNPRDIEADVLKLALRKGVNSNTALAAHRNTVAQKLGINPALVTPQAEEASFYQDHDPTDLQKNYPALAKYLQVDGNAELVGKNLDPLKEIETFYRRSENDPAIMLAKGAIGVASTIVGLGNLVSAGKAGKYIEDQGIDFKKIQSVLSDLYTPESQAAVKDIVGAKGFLGTLEAAAKNPSAVGLWIGESLPQMYLGTRVLGGALLSAFPAMAPGTAGAIGEGLTMAGGSAEHIRRETDTGELTGGQAALAVGVGVIGTGLSKFGNALATKLGIEDVDAAMVAGKLLTRLEDSGVPKQLAVRLIGGAAVEGGVEEMPQSITEQIAQNVALGRPWDEGVPENAAIGLVTGGAMGAAAQVGAVKGKVPTTTEETPAEKQARATVQNSILRTAAAVNAEEQRNALKEWGKRVSADNPLRRESPQSFKEFVRTMADENGAIKEVFVDAKLLNETLGQAGIDKDKLAAEMPEVAESLNEALVTNGEVRIPIEDYATHIVGTPVESAIIDHLRTAPDGMTYAESQVFFQQQQDDFIKQAEALVNLNEPVLTRKEFAAQAPDGVQYEDYLAAHKNKVEAFATDLQEVHDKLLAGLESTGRFPRSISKVYAIPFREFYATNAARMGMLPSELYASLPLNFEQMSAGDILNQKAFHGSPHSFNKFSTKNIGIGEGAQAYGHGLYFTDTKTVAEHYRQAHKSNKLVFADGTDLKEASNGTEEKFAQTLLKANSGDYAKSLAENKVGENASTGDKRFAKAVEKILKDYKKKGVKAVSLSGGIYEVELAPKDDEYLLWDKPLGEQSEKVKVALGTITPTGELNPDGLDMGGAVIRDNRERQASPDSVHPWVLATSDGKMFGLSQKDVDRMLADNGEKATGENIYTRLTALKGSQKAASDYLHSIGIRGIKYLDGTSRSKGEGSYNYVIFSDADVAIKQVYGQSAKIPPTVNVDGVERPTTNSEGKLIHPTEEGIRNFWKWFGDSKVVDDQGRPLVVYHGTAADFTEFSADFMYTGEGASQSGSGFYFTTDRESSSNYALMAQEKRNGTGGSVSPVYLALRKPISIDFMKGEVSGAGINLTRARVRKIIMAAPGIKEADGPLSNYGDVEYEGFNRVLNEAVDQYAGGNNIAALRNDFYGDDHGAWLRALKVATGFDSAKSVTPAGATHFIAWNPNQIKSAIGNNGDFSASPNILEQSAFYSALQREIPSISKIADKNGMVKTDQALSWVEARQKEGKFKLEEVEAVGLKDWLQATEGKVSVADIENFVAENGVQIEEKLLGEPSDEINGEPAFYEYDPEQEQYAVYSYRIDQTEYYDSETEAADRVDELNAGVPQGGTKFEAYKLPGGENYRELLLTLPKTDGQDFKSAHYDEKNILAHVRFDDRTNPTTGQKILFIEEIQSDWAQEGRKKGFIRPLTPDEKRLQTLNKKSFTDEGLSKEEEKIADDLRSRGVGDSLMSAVKGTPAAPFVQNTKSWVALAVKRMLRYAAENGYDQIAWTTGEQQAARYDLSMQISEASAISNGNGTYNLVLIDKADNEIPPYSRSGKKLTAKEMEDLIGKELTDRLVKGADASKDKPWPKNTDTNPAFYTLRGLDLKVGGEGMLAFYDKLLPQVVSDVAKKLGGGKVAAVDFGETFEQYLKRRGLFVNPTDGRVYASKDFDPRTRTVGTLGEIRKRFEADNTREKGTLGAQPSLDITPEMRDKIMSGLPLFQGQRAGFDPSTFTMSLLKGADLSSVIHEGAHFYLEALADLAGRENAPQQIKDDFRTTLDWFGITGNEAGTPGGDLLEQRAFHGSPHDHNKFDSANIGTGEGAQAYGYGHYFTDTREVAEFYKGALENSNLEIDGKAIPNISGGHRNVDVIEKLLIDTYGLDDRTASHIALAFNKASSKADVVKWMNNRIEMYRTDNSPEAVKQMSDVRDTFEALPIKIEAKNTGKLYEVELAPEQDEYLLWDKPLSEQSEKVKVALGEIPTIDSIPGRRLAKQLSSNTDTGSAIYNVAFGGYNNPKVASERLHSLGIRGIKYLDGSSRAKGEGAYNYVIFDDEDIEIINKYAQSAKLPETITIDGAERPTMNSEGRPIYPTEEGIRNFWKWFGNSDAKVRRNPTLNGRPSVMYHTTKGDFNTFEVGRKSTNSNAFGSWETFRSGIFVAPEVTDSELYGMVGPDSGYVTGANVLPVYVRAEKPLDLFGGLSEVDATLLEEAGLSPSFLYSRQFGHWEMFDDEQGQDTVAAIKRAGYDSVIYSDENPDTGEPFESWVVFSPDQIKSAIGNNGDFSNDPNILEQGGSTPSVIVDDTLLSIAEKDTKSASGVFKSDLENDQQGVVPGRLTNINAALKRGDYTLADITNSWNQTRDYLRSRYGDTVMLYRVNPPESERNPDTQVVYMGDESLAKRFETTTRKVEAYQVPVDNIVALNARPSGYYEFIVKRPTERQSPPGQLPPGRTPEEIWRSMTLDQKRPYHEQWAQSYERYTLEGKAPTVEMQSVFSRFREWMLSVYKSMKDFLAQNPLAGKLNDDIRGVFDRLIASEDKIYQAEEARGYAALFGSAAEAGLSEKEFEDYQNLGKLASTRAVDEMNARSIRDMRWLSNAKDKAIKKLQAEANTKRAAIKAQVSDEVDAMPLNRARNFLTKGEFIDESGVRRESETKFKLNEAEVKAVSNGQVPDNIKGMIAPDGIGLELAAKLLGYQSPETLIGDLTNGESRDVTIQGLTDQRMLEQYGDLTDDKAIERAAEKAIHNEARARFMATGLKLLTKTELSAAQLNRAAKMAAEATIAKKKIRAINPGQFTRAEAKANREAIENVARDPKAAIDAQRAALLNNRLAKAALEAADDVDSILKYFKKFDSQGVRKAIGIDQADQIDDLLQSVDRDKSTPLREIDKRQALADWVAEQEADGFEPVLDPILAEQIKTKHYKDMTVDELRMLRDTVKQIEHVGRLKQTLLTEMGRADFRARVEEAENSIRDNANRIVEERGTPTDVAGLTGQWVRQMFASHRKFSSFIREMDGGRDGGVMWRLLSKNMNAAGDSEVEMRRASSEALSGLFKGFTQDKTPLNLYAKRMRIPGTDIAMTQEQRIMFAMNWGNEGNRQRLLDGGITGKRALSINDANAILGTLTKPEWDFVQGVWDHIATYKDQIAALERKITGIEPEWVEPVEIKTKHGTYRGGYFPAKYDIELSSRSESLEAAVDMRMGMQGAFNTAATRSGYTKARSEAVMNRPLLLSYNVIANHISEVTHRLAWQPWLIDANRLLKALDAPIRQYYGAEVLREMRNTVNDIAAGDVGARTPMERAINHLRTGSTIVGMGWRFSTAFLQPSGLAQSWARIGGRWMTKGIAETFKNLNSASELVNSKSSLMKNRDITMNREVRDVLDQIRTTEGINAVTGSYFSLIGKMQRVVDIPTWLGAYEKALHDMQYEHAVDSEQRAQIESDAVAMADQAVIDSQSGGQIKDLASIQRGHPGLKLFTNFYSYFSATYNLNIEALRRTNFRSPTDVALLAGDLVLLNIIPVLFATALKEMTKGKCGDDLDCLVKSYGYEQAGYMFGQMVLLRDMGSAALVAAGGDQYGYSGPAGLRFFSDLYKAGVQANQGELDWPLFKSVSNTAGVLLHFPVGQVNTTLEGIMAVENGDVEGVSILPALLFGPPKEGK